MPRYHFAKQGLLFTWHISEKVSVFLDTRTMEVTIQQGYEGEKVVLEAKEWTKMMFSIDREMGKERHRLARMLAVTAGGKFVTVRPERGPWWRRIAQWWSSTFGSSATSAP